MLVILVGPLLRFPQLILNCFKNVLVASLQEVLGVEHRPRQSVPPPETSPDDVLHPGPRPPVVLAPVLVDPGHLSLGHRVPVHEAAQAGHRPLHPDQREGALTQAGAQPPPGLTAGGQTHV